MGNNILRKRIIRLLAISYARNETELWVAYEKIGNLEKLLNLLENNELDRI